MRPIRKVRTNTRELAKCLGVLFQRRQTNPRSCASSPVFHSHRSWMLARAVAFGFGRGVSSSEGEVPMRLAREASRSRCRRLRSTHSTICTFSDVDRLWPSMVVDYTLYSSGDHRNIVIGHAQVVAICTSGMASGIAFASRGSVRSRNNPRPLICVYVMIYYTHDCTH